MLGRIGRFLKSIAAARPRGGDGRAASAAKPVRPSRAGIAAAQGDEVVRSSARTGATPGSAPASPAKAGSLVGGPVPAADLEVIRRPEESGVGGAKALDPGRRARATDPGLRATDPELRARPADPGLRAVDPELRAPPADPGLREIDPGREKRTGGQG
jgi:hypothetical protein